MTSPKKSTPQSSAGQLPRRQDVVDFLVERDVLAYALLDQDLVTRETAGQLSKWIPLDKPICSTPPFTGLEDDLAELRDGLESRIVIPNISLEGTRNSDERLSLELYWDPVGVTYVVLVHRLGGRSELEYELVKQVRARKLAESNFLEAQHEIDEREHVLSTLANEAPAMVAMLDADLNYVFATALWSTTFSLDKEPLIGRAHTDVLPQTSQHTLDGLKACCSGASYRSDIEELFLPDGRQEWVIWNAAPWHRSDGSVGGVFLNADLRSREVGREERLQMRTEKLQSEIKRIDEFNAILAHDFRAPLRSLRHQLATLQVDIQGGSNAANPERLAKCIMLTNRLDQMVTDLDDYAKIETQSGKERKIDLAVMLQEIAASIFPDNDWQLDFNSEYKTVYASPAALDIVLRNLIDNAVKHHDRPPGKIEVRLDRTDQSGRIIFEDDGPGIELKAISEIFRPFWTLNEHEDDSITNSGMGLAFVKKVADFHGWTIEAIPSSSNKRGMKFHIILPCDKIIG